MRCDAFISDDGKYRYSLFREWNGDLPLVVFVMLNPSTADAEKDDPTIRRCIRFAKDWGYGSLRVVNLFAYRATDPRELLRTDDPVGRDNSVIVQVWTRSFDTIAAWGGNPIARHMDPAIRRALENARQLDCLGLTKTGNQPRHPLYVRADKEREPFVFPTTKDSDHG